MIKKLFLLLALIIAPALFGMDATNPEPDMTVTNMKGLLESRNLCIQYMNDCLNPTQPRISNWTRRNYEEALPGLEKARDLLQLKIWEQEPPANDLDRGMMLWLKKVYSK